MATKRPKFELRKEVARAADRRPVMIAGICRVGDGEAQEVTVTDLAPFGCSLQGISVGVTKADPLQLWLDGHGPVAARLKWARRGALGLAFETPLDAALVERLYRASDEANVVPLRRRAPR